jgi:glycosyltransferase involved in cell wall biosynthesis
VLDGEGARIVQEASAGVVVPAEDVDGLAEAVLRMYRMEVGTREQMGLNGLRYFEEHFERAILLDRLEYWLQEMKEKGCR